MGTFVGELNVFATTVFWILGAGHQPRLEQSLNTAEGGGDRTFRGETETRDRDPASRQSGAQKLGEHAPGGVGFEDADQGAGSALIDVIDQLQ